MFLVSFAIKRLLSFILAIYVIVLTGIPCCAFDRCEEEYSTKKAATQKNHPAPKRNDSCKNCSPFFCHNCGAYVVAHCNFECVPAISFCNKIFNVYVSPFSPRYFPFLWQPPDIA